MIIYIEEIEQISIMRNMWVNLFIVFLGTHVAALKKTLQPAHQPQRSDAKPADAADAAPCGRKSFKDGRDVCPTLDEQKPAYVTSWYGSNMS